MQCKAKMLVDARNTDSAMQNYVTIADTDDSFNRCPSSEACKWLEMSAF